MLSRSDVTSLVGDELLPKAIAQAQEAEVIDKWHRVKNDAPKLPHKATKEHKDLSAVSMTGWLRLIVTTLVQALYIEGFNNSDGSTSPAWGHWQANGMDARQIPLHRAAIAHGQAFATVTPGDLGPVIRGHSMRHFYAAWDDAAVDDHPVYALRHWNGDRDLKLYEADAVWTLRMEKRDGASEGTPVIQSVTRHPAGVCPVVRFANTIDLDGRCESEIEPLIPNAARIDLDTQHRLLVQHFQAWAVRVLTGIEKPEDSTEAELERRRLAIEDILILASPDSSATTLPPTPMNGIIEAKESDIRDLAAVSQTPPHYMLGSIVNLSAEALAAAEAGHQRKGVERKHTLGESHEQMLRLAAWVAGDAVTAQDFAAQVRWADMESRSLSQVADALGKLSQMLGIPPQVLWDRIPGWTSQDTDEALKVLQESDALAGILDTLTAQSEPDAVGV